MLNLRLCDYSDAYILVKGAVSVANTAVVDANARNINIKVIFKNCITKINNTQVDNAKSSDVGMPMCNLLGCSDNYSKISRGRDEPVLDKTGDNTSLYNRSDT